MKFVVRGFTPAAGFRVFAFEGVEADHSRTNFSVRAELTLVHRYGIRLQDLPLLCRQLLERHEDLAQTRDLTLTEADMSAQQSDRAEARRVAEQKRKPHRRPPPGNAGSAWRTQAAVSSVKS